MTHHHSPAPWGYGYSPYQMSRRDHDGTEGEDVEIPAYEIFAADGTKVFDSNEDTPAELQEANSRLATAAPTMLAALLAAQQALNTAPRFRVGETDSYQIASEVDAAIAQATTG